MQDKVYKCLCTGQNCDEQQCEVDWFCFKKTIGSEANEISPFRIFIYGSFKTKAILHRKSRWCPPPLRDCSRTGVSKYGVCIRDKQRFVKMIVIRVVRLRECPLRDLPLYNKHLNDCVTTISNTLKFIHEYSLYCAPYIQLCSPCLEKVVEHFEIWEIFTGFITF